MHILMRIQSYFQDRKGGVRRTRVELLMGVMAAVGTGERNVSAHLVPIRRACTFNTPNMSCAELIRKLTNLHTICRILDILRSDEVYEGSVSGRSRRFYHSAECPLLFSLCEMIGQEFPSTASGEGKTWTIFCKT
jgi:hypothetical protein